LLLILKACLLKEDKGKEDNGSVKRQGKNGRVKKGRL
jgi:hypothetical protein